MLEKLKLSNGHSAGIDTDILRRSAMADNVYRGRVLAAAVICFEFIFLTLDIVALLIHVRSDFHYLTYLLMYGLMIAVNLCFLLLTKQKIEFGVIPAKQLRRAEHLFLAYMTFNMSWGSLISLLDQKLYGQLLAFMVNMISVSVFFVVDWRRMLTPYLLSTGLLIIGLPFFQTSADVLFSHYVNLTVFVAISWIASRLVRQSYCRNLASRLELENANRLLAVESREKQKINEKLSQANFQLHQLSLVDDLTSLANRRGLRNFINQVFDQKEQQVENLAVIMLDLDYFKSYNDNYGHFAGDQVLVAVAGVLAEEARASLEIAARWGGEEFIALLFNTDQRELAARADRIRQQVESLGIIHQHSRTASRVTVSIGTSHQNVCEPTDVAQAIGSADIAMYLAKEHGRNQVINS